MGNFDEAVRSDPDLLRTILQLIKEHYAIYGEFPTEKDLRAHLGLPPVAPR